MVFCRTSSAWAIWPAAMPSGLTTGQALRLWLPLAGALVLHLLLWQHGARVSSLWRVQLATAQAQSKDSAAVRTWRAKMPLQPPSTANSDGDDAGDHR